MLPILTCLAGFALGMTCNVFVFAPIFLLGTAIALGASFVSGYSVYELFLASVLPTICLQAGYMMGLTGRDSLSGLLSRATPSTSKQA